MVPLFIRNFLTHASESACAGCLSLPGNVSALQELNCTKVCEVLILLRKWHAPGHDGEVSTSPPSPSPAPVGASAAMVAGCPWS